jgi:hypothetical protein
MPRRPSELSDHEVMDVIRGDLYRRFMVIFEYTHRITGEVPLQPSNEIRLALNHISDALQIQTVTEIKRSITNAQGHIMLATIDCFMISIISRLEFLSNFIEGLKKINVSVPSIFDTQLSLIRSLRDQFRPRLGEARKDHQGRQLADLESLSQTYNFLTILLTQCNSLYEELLDKFPAEELIRGRARQIWERAGRPFGRADEHWLRAEAEIFSKGRA